MFKVTEQVMLTRRGSITAEVVPAAPCALDGCLGELLIIGAWGEGLARVHLDETNRRELIKALGGVVPETAHSGDYGAGINPDCDCAVFVPADDGHCVECGGSRPAQNPAHGAADHECLIKDGRCIVKGHDETRAARRVAWSAVTAAAHSADYGVRAKVITLCGSTKFKEEINRANAELTMQGDLVISLGVFGHVDMPDHDWTTNGSADKSMLDDLHKRKIDLADEIMVINVGGYIGESTRGEIAYAESRGKPVRYWESAQNPAYVASGVTVDRIQRDQMAAWLARRGVGLTPTPGTVQRGMELDHADAALYEVARVEGYSCDEHGTCSRCDKKIGFTVPGCTSCANYRDLLAGAS